MAITRREINFKDKLLLNSYKFLHNRLNNNRTDVKSKERIAIAMAKSGIRADMKVEMSGEISLKDLMTKAGKV